MLVGYKFIEATFRIVKSASNINFCDTEVCEDIAILYTRLQISNGYVYKVLYCTHFVLSVVLMEGLRFSLHSCGNRRQEYN